MKKVKQILGYMLYFILCFWVIFSNFISIPNISTRFFAILEFLIATFAAIYFPYIICIQHHTINELENLIDELETKSLNDTET